MLTYKKCNTTAETSINSFRNELETLKCLRWQYNSSIAEYYIQEKHQWNENDIIYMKTYKQNIYSLFKTHKMISFRKKLEITYLIAKGLCFLYKSRICHRDFKTQNIVVDSRLAPKIIDFGSCAAHFPNGTLSVYDERCIYL